MYSSSNDDGLPSMYSAARFLKGTGEERYVARNKNSHDCFLSTERSVAGNARCVLELHSVNDRMSLMFFESKYVLQIPAINRQVVLSSTKWWRQYQCFSVLNFRIFDVCLCFVINNIILTWCFVWKLVIFLPLYNFSRYLMKHHS